MLFLLVVSLPLLLWNLETHLSLWLLSLEYSTRFSDFLSVTKVDEW